MSQTSRPPRRRRRLADAPDAPPPERPPLQVPNDTQPDLELPSSLAILPSRDAVLYPSMLLPMQVSQPRWVRLLSEVVSSRQPVGLFLQR